ncbi:hypothetical protein GW17_00045231, partial [Ensete ventricosum]
GNSPEVHRELVESIGSLLGWRKGVRRKKIETHRKKTETHRKIVGSSRKAYRESEVVSLVVMFDCNL